MKKSRLKRRLRKKFHVGEYQEFGFEVFVTLKPQLTEAAFDEFLSDFIDLVEANKLLFSGGGKEESWGGFITSAKKFASPAENDRQTTKGWLENRPGISETKVGEFQDAWND
ncbi:MAG TPA: 50S ribosome-binding protein YggL [Pyrinomonadaceae bacterium]|nr:50S ribosome-binding protein YggL [Pyrinomonadaceae bacterium]